MTDDDSERKTLDALEPLEMIHYEEGGAKTIVRFKGREENGDVRYELLNGEERTEDPDAFMENAHLVL